MPRWINFIAVLLLAAGSSACAVISVAGAAAGAVISVTGAVVSTGVKVTGKVVEKTIDALTPAEDAAAKAAKAAAKN